MNYSVIDPLFFFPPFPDGCSYLASMDETFLNNEVQICMYPTHLNM